MFREPRRQRLARPALGTTGTGRQLDLWLLCMAHDGASSNLDEPGTPIAGSGARSASVKKRSVLVTPDAEPSVAAPRGRASGTSVRLTLRLSKSPITGSGATAALSKRVLMWRPPQRGFDWRASTGAGGRRPMGTFDCPVLVPRLQSATVTRPAARASR